MKASVPPSFSTFVDLMTKKVHLFIAIIRVALIAGREARRPRSQNGARRFWIAWETARHVTDTQRFSTFPGAAFPLSTQWRAWPYGLEHLA